MRQDHAHWSPVPGRREDHRARLFGVDRIEPLRECRRITGLSPFEELIPSNDPLWRILNDDEELEVVMDRGIDLPCQRCGLAQDDPGIRPLQHL